MVIPSNLAASEFHCSIHENVILTFFNLPQVVSDCATRVLQRWNSTLNLEVPSLNNSSSFQSYSEQDEKEDLIDQEIKESLEIMKNKFDADLSQAAVVGS